MNKKYKEEKTKELNNIPETSETPDPEKKRGVTRKYIYIAELVIALVLIIFFICINKIIDEKNAVISKGHERYSFRIDSAVLNNEDKTLRLSGWCYKNDLDVPALDSAEAGQFRVYLVKDGDDIRTPEEFSAKAIPFTIQRVERPDVQKVFGEKKKLELTASGFKAQCTFDDIADGYYIVIKYNEEEKAFNTGVYLKDIIVYE